MTRVHAPTRRVQTTRNFTANPSQRLPSTKIDKQTMSDNPSSNIKSEFSRHKRRLVLFIAVVIILQAATLYFILFAFLETTTNPVILITLILASIALIAVGFTTYTMTDALEARVEQKAFEHIRDKVLRLETAVKLSQALQKMASTLRATQSFEQVMEQALDVCGLLFEESGIPSRSLVGGCLLI